MGYKHFNKTLLFCAGRSISCYKDKDCTTNVTFIGSIPVLHAETLYPHCYSPDACTPKKVIRHVTSNCDVCDIDLDMQINQLSKCWVIAVFVSELIACFFSVLSAVKLNHVRITNYAAKITTPARWGSLKV